MNKIIASVLTAIMTLATFAGAALAADLGDYPSFLIKDNQLDALIVVGADAKPADVVGAVDLAVRLAASSVVVKDLPGGAAVSGITGLDRDGIGIGTASGGSALDACAGCDYSNTFPSGNVLKNFHFSGLQDSTLTWRSNQYDYSEQVNLNGVRMRHDYSTSNVNGTLKMEVQSGDVFYEYVFDKPITGLGGSAATGAGGPNYTYPLEITMMGVPFTIVGVGSNQVRMLSGSIGIATPTSGVTSGDYTVYSDVGASDNWARILIKDAAGNTVDTLTVNEGDTKTSSATSLDVKLTDVKTVGTSGDVASANIVVGPTGTVEKLYDTTADTTSTGTASDRFSGTTDWGIRVAPGNFSTEGQIAAGDRLQVRYQPTSTKYLVAGEKVSLPNSYGELGFVGFGTSNLATVTIEPITSVSAYNSTGSVVGSNLNGFKISSDVAGSIVSLAGNGYDAGYLLFTPSASSTAGFETLVGFWDKANSRIRTADSATAVTSDGGNPTIHANSSTEYAWYNATSITNSPPIRYGFRVSYAGAGEKSFWLNATVNPNSTRVVTDFRTGDATLSVNMSTYNNKTAWTSSAAPEFRLGVTAASAEAADVGARTEGDTADETIGTSTQDVLDDVGIIVVSPNSNSASDKVVVKYPSRELTSNVYFGTSGATAAGTSGTYSEPLPIKTAVAKLDTEISDAATVGKHLVLVGGPAVNSLTAQAMGLSYPTYGSSGLLPYSEGEGYISLHDGVFASGQMVVTVQGWEAANTRNSASVLQQFDTFASQLDGQTAVKVASVSTAGITPA